MIAVVLCVTVSASDLACTVGGLRGAICATYDLLRCGTPSSGSGETDTCCASSYRRGNIDRKRDRKGVRRDGCICNGHGQRGAVISHVRLKDIAAVEVYPSAQSSGRYRWRSPVYISTSGV